MHGHVTVPREEAPQGGWLWRAYVTRPGSDTPTYAMIGAGIQPTYGQATRQAREACAQAAHIQGTTLASVTITTREPSEG